MSGSVMVIRAEGKNKLYINNIEVNLPAEFRDCLEFNELVIVVLDRQFSVRNIYAYSSSGELKWIVDPIPFQTVPPGYSMIAVENGSLRAVAKGTYVLDGSSGKILKEINEYK